MAWHFHPGFQNSRLNSIKRLAYAAMIAALAWGLAPTAVRAQTNWSKVQGGGRDVALAGDGTAWIVGNQAAGTSFRIYRLPPGAQAPQPVPGEAVRIAVSGATPWAVDAQGQIMQFQGTSWRRVAGPKAHDIGAGANGVWITAEPRRGDDYSIYQWTGNGWRGVTGGAQRIDVDARGNPWVVNSGGQIFAHVSNTWQRFQSQEPATDISVDTFGEPWIIGRSGALWQYRAKDRKWQSHGGQGTAVAQRGGRLLQIDPRQQIQQVTLRDGAPPAPVPTADATQPPSQTASGDVIIPDSGQTLTTIGTPQPTSGTTTSSSSLTDGASSADFLSVKLTTEYSCKDIPNHPACTGQDVKIEVRGCFTGDSPLCFSRQVASDPYPQFHGQLNCPIINPGPPPRMQKSCAGKGAQAKKWGRAVSGDKPCDAYLPVTPGWGVPFHDPIYGGTCYSCPLGYTRSWAHVEAPADALLQPCTTDFVWNLPQYPEPGLYEFLFLDLSSDYSPLLDRALGNSTLVDAYLNRRANGDPAKKTLLWKRLLESPGDSAELKALTFAAFLTILNEGRTGQHSSVVSRVEEYVEKRRSFIVAEAQQIYEAWQSISGFEQTEALRASIRQGGGTPMTDIASWVVGDSGSVDAKIFGSMPVDSLGYAWASALPDTRGVEFIAALSDLVTMSAKGELGSPLPGSEASFDPALFAQSLSLIVDIIGTLGDVGDVADDVGNIASALKVLGKIKGMTEASTALSVFSNSVQVALAVMTIHAQNEAETAMREAHAIAGRKVNLYATIGKERKDLKSDIDKVQLLLYWALATSPYRGSRTLGEGAVAQSCQGPWKNMCDRTKKRLAPMAAAGLAQSTAATAIQMVTGRNPLAAKTSQTASLRWAEAAGRPIPQDAVVAGKHRTGPDLVVCRADMGDGIHPGKIWGGKCNVGWGGREIAKPQFDVLEAGKGAVQWIARAAGQPVPANAVVAGNHKNGTALSVCRADMGDGVHPGKVWGGKCNVGWGGKEIAKPKYDVLVRAGG